MATRDADSRKVFHLSGKDSPGALTDYCALLASNNTRLLHLSQSVVHGCLVINAEVSSSEPCNLIPESESFAALRGLQLEVTDLPSDGGAEKSCGLWVTVLGDLSSAQAVSEVGAAIRAEGLTLLKVESIGKNTLLGINMLASREQPIGRSELVEVRGRLLSLGPSLKVDLAVQRDDIYRTSKRLLCMDVDSTFVKGEFIDELAELVGVKSQVAEITDRAMRGELDFEQSLRQRVRLLAGLKMSRARELCDRFELTPGAEELVRTVKQLGMRVGLVSGGFDFFVETLKGKFGLDFTFANELGVENEMLTGEVVGAVVDSKRKAQVLKDMAHVFGIRQEQTIAVGDGANDIEMLQAAGLGIAYQAKPRLQEVADTRFNQNDRLDTLLYLMGFDARVLVGACQP